MWKLFSRVIGIASLTVHSMILITLYPAWAELANPFAAMFGTGYIMWLMGFGTYYIFWE